MKNHTALAAASLLVLGLARAAGDTASLEARVSSKEKELAVLYADFWRTQYRVALGDTKATILPIRARIRLVVTEPRFLARLRATTFSEPLAERRRHFFLEEAADSQISSDPQLSTLSAKMSGASVDRVLTREQAWPRTVALSKALGLDLTRLPVELKVADIAFGGGTYPIRFDKEVRILVNAYAGLTFQDTLLHKAGHALHYCLVDEPTFLLQANSAQPFDEGLGQVMSLMLYRPEVGTRLFSLSIEQVQAMAEAYRLGSLFDLRQKMAASLFEFEAYANPDQDLAALSDRLTQKYVGVSTHGLPVWAFNPFYATGPIYIQSYVIAEMVGRQIHQALDRRFGRAWGPDAGAHLRKKFFSQGGALTLDEIIVQGTGEPLTAAALVGALASP